MHGFLPFSPSLAELCSVWYGLKDLFTLHTLADKVVIDDVTSGRCTCITLFCTFLCGHCKTTT